jgi:phosphatidylserine/phosphatidylglycerophosphate/cardiolipin synthase-like enzyme
MSDALVAPSARARFVVTLPPEPSEVGSRLSALAGETFTSLTDTKDAFLHLARRAKERLVILTPYIDVAGATWAADLFAASTAPDKTLVLRGLVQLDSCGAAGVRARSLATRLLNYEITTDQGIETFHAKVVLADGVAAYVGSANFLYRSREKNLECGFLLEGDAVGPVAVLVDALLAINL